MEYLKDIILLALLLHRSTNFAHWNQRGI